LPSGEKCGNIYLVKKINISIIINLKFFLLMLRKILKNAVSSVLAVFVVVLGVVAICVIPELKSCDVLAMIVVTGMNLLSIPVAVIALALLECNKKSDIIKFACLAGICEHLMVGIMLIGSFLIWGQFLVALISAATTVCVLWLLFDLKSSWPEDEENEKLFEQEEFH
jgi:hypothetical protein